MAGRTRTGRRQRPLQGQRGEWVQAGTSWYTVLVWGQLAENAAASIGKGERVIVAGRFTQRDYTTDNGEKRTVWELTAEKIGISLRHATAAAASTTPQPAHAPA